MAKFNVCVAYDIPAYATVIVEANTESEAQDRALEMVKEGVCDFEPEWSSWDNLRVADIQEGETTEIEATHAKDGAPIRE